jgi:hypothetical protein
VYAGHLNDVSPSLYMDGNHLVDSFIRDGEGVNMQANARGQIENYLFQHNRRAD